jgi:hypothetical protein
MTSLGRRGLVHLGMDVSRGSISLAVLHPDRDVAVVDKIASEAESVRRLVKRVGRPGGLWACYEAGPTGYDLYRLLTKMGGRCDVVAPSLVPKGRGDRVKTDQGDARRLAGLHRAGELTAIAVPSPAQEAVRDLCRTRGDMVADWARARNRLTKFLLRHSPGHLSTARTGPPSSSAGWRACTSRSGPRRHLQPLPLHRPAPGQLFGRRRGRPAGLLRPRALRRRRPGSRRL